MEAIDEFLLSEIRKCETENILKHDNRYISMDQLKEIASLYFPSEINMMESVNNLLSNGKIRRFETINKTHYATTEHHGITEAWNYDFNNRIKRK